MEKNNYSLKHGIWIYIGDVHKSERLEPIEMKHLLSLGGGIVRNHFNFDCTQKTSFWFVIKDKFGGMEELSSKMRNQVKKSLRTYDIEIISKKEFIDIGLNIFNAALNNYRVKAKPISETRWNEQWEKWPDNTDYWCVKTKDTHTPVALAVNGVFEESTEYWIMKANPDFLNSTYPYYGLIYQMNEYYLVTKRKRFVCDGARTTTEHSQIQDFLIQKFKFRKAYSQLQISYKWYFWLLIKALYPFRRIIPIPQVRAVLNLEAMNRNSI